MKLTKIFDLTDSESAQLTNERDANSHEMQFDSEWDAMSATGTNCHRCLKLDWECDIVPRCVCHRNYHQPHES